MLLKSIKQKPLQNKATNSTYEFVAFENEHDSLSCTTPLHSHVITLQTNRLAPANFVPINDRRCDHSPYQGFNLGLHVGDDVEQVQENRRHLVKLLPSNTEIQWLDQVHGNEVVQVSMVSPQPLIADAAITCQKNICLAIMTADCLPILLTDKRGQEVAAIHGGWRPLAANIITQTLTKMQSQPDDILAWLGPCIGNTAFEVGTEVRAQFVNQHRLFAPAFTPSKPAEHLSTKHLGNKGLGDKYLADLHAIAKIQLQLLGVKHISSLPECTFTQTDKYYSYRKHAVTGRMASLICLI